MSSSPHSASIQALVDELGGEIATYKVHRWNYGELVLYSGLFVVLTCIVLFISVNVSYFFLIGKPLLPGDKSNYRSIEVPVILLVLIGIIGYLGFALFNVFGRIPTHVVACKEGIIAVARQPLSFTWKSIVKINHDVCNPSKSQNSQGTFPMTKNTGFIVWRADNEQLFFDGHRLSNSFEFANWMIAKASKHSIPICSIEDEQNA